MTQAENEMLLKADVLRLKEDNDRLEEDAEGLKDTVAELRDQVCLGVEKSAFHVCPNIPRLNLAAIPPPGG